MAEYCNQCAQTYGMEPGDLKGIGDSSQVLEPGYGWGTICEGCGFICVDNEGNCLGGPHCMKKHHEPAPERCPKHPTYKAVHQPRCECEPCWKIWRSACQSSSSSTCSPATPPLDPSAPSPELEI